jgi:hypothetical protein
MGGIVKSIFGGAKTPKVQDVPVVNSQADRDKQDAAAAEERRRAASSGRASTIFTSALGDVSQPTLASKVLLGDG